MCFKIIPVILQAKGTKTLLTMTTQENTFQEKATVFNPAQLYLLEMFSRVKTEEQLQEIKNLLAGYYAKKVDEGTFEHL